MFMFFYGGFGWHNFLYTFNISDQTLSTNELEVIDTVKGRENLEEKTREVADIRMYHIGKNFLQRT